MGENASDCRNVSEIFVLVQDGDGFERDIIDIKRVDTGVASAGVFRPRKGCDDVRFHFGIAFILGAERLRP